MGCPTELRLGQGNQILLYGHIQVSTQTGDKILTMVNGVEVEASVVRLSLELEVKTPDGKLWWRALGRVRPIAAAAPAEAPAAPSAPSAPVVTAAPAAEPTVAQSPTVEIGPSAEPNVATTKSRKRKR